MLLLGRIDNYALIKALWKILNNRIEEEKQMIQDIGHRFCYLSLIYDTSSMCSLKLKQ